MICPINDKINKKKSSDYINSLINFVLKTQKIMLHIHSYN
jgi:hypothetical protein